MTQHGSPPASGGPSAALAAVYVDDQYVSWLALGDVSILVANQDGTVELVLDDRLSRVAIEEREALRALRREGLGPGDNRYENAWRKLVAVEEEQRNAEGGYWICADDPTAARHALVGRATSQDVAGFALLSDGAFDVLALEYRDPATLWAFLARVGPEAAIASVRELELDRTIKSKSDDAAVVLALTQ